MARNIIFLDKDGTLGEFQQGDCGLYPGAKGFLETEKAKGRELYIATTAGDPGRQHLEEVICFLDGYFGQDQLRSSKGFYFKQGNCVVPIGSDYETRIELLPEDERERTFAHADSLCNKHDKAKEEEKQGIRKELDSFWSYWRALVHRETKEPFDESRRYKNPNVKGIPMKDLYLARLLISPDESRQLRTVMVGDGSDAVVTDPEIPLIVVQRNWPEEWGAISSLLETFFGDRERQPWQVYDTIFKEGNRTKSSDEKLSKIGRHEFIFERTEFSERMAYLKTRKGNRGLESVDEAQDSRPKTALRSQTRHKTA